MSNIAHVPVSGVHLKRSGVKVKLWPNGELSFYREKKFNLAAVVERRKKTYDTLAACCIRAYGLAGGLVALRSLGLSPHPNFDKPKTKRAVFGLKGISGKGKRRVRNACFLMTREAGRHRLTFSTVTLPPMALGNLERAHRNWHKLIDFYRREVSRVLKRNGLTGEIVGVSEIQEKRYEKSGIPVLHAHFVFIGAGRNGGWVLSPRRHDRIWRRALATVLGLPRIDCSAACQLKSVKESAEGYLGKYMSKGAKVCAVVIADGFGDWLPRQWWNCSRELVRRMETDMRIFSHGISWLAEKATEENSDIFLFFSNVMLERDDGSRYAIASYGRLSKSANGLVRKILNLDDRPENIVDDHKVMRSVKKT